jgi:hypothetical protein
MFLSIINENGDVKISSSRFNKGKEPDKEKQEGQYDTAQIESASKIIHELSIKARTTIRDLDPTVYCYIG